MTAHFVLCILFLAYVEASPFLSTSTSITTDVGTPTTFTNSQAASPTCFQPRALSDPPASQISSALKDATAVSRACSNTTTQRSENETFYYNAGAYYFNITRRNGDPKSGLVQVQASYCSQQFQNIINICLLKQSFWGGWAQIGNANWSISNNIYPQNLLPLSRLVNPFSTTGQLPTTQYGNVLPPKGSSTPASSIVSEDLSRLILAIENVVSNDKISLSAVAAASPKTNSSTRSISSRQSQKQLGSAFDPSVSSIATSTGTSAIARQGNASKPAALAPKTQQSTNSSPTTKPSSQNFQQGAFVNSVSLNISSTQISGLQIQTTAPLPGSLMGGNGSVVITPISGPLTIAPDYTITDAFQANLSTTTVSASNGAVLVYSMQTFSNLANRTGTPFLVQTTVPETLANGSHVTYIGGVWVASGGRYWFPPGVPKPESGGGLKPGDRINPPCIWPFCSGKITSDGGGGGDPKGDPPPPYEPPNPPPADAPPADESGEEPDQETQDSHTRTEEKRSQTSRQSAQKTTEVSRQTSSTSSSSSYSSLTHSTAPPTSSSSSRSTVPSSSSSSKIIVSSSSSSNIKSTVTSSSHSTVPSSSSRLSTASSVTKSSSPTISSTSMSAYGSAQIFDGTFVDYDLSIADANAAAQDALSGVNAVTVPNGILWVPTGSQELAYAAQATSPFDLALPTFANFTDVPSLSSSTDSISPQSTTIGTRSLMQTTSLSAVSSSSATATANANAEALAIEIAGLAALAVQLASSSAVVAANEPPSSSPIPPAPTPLSVIASPSSSRFPPTLTPPPSPASPIVLFQCTQM